MHSKRSTQKTIQGQIQEKSIHNDFQNREVINVTGELNKHTQKMFQRVKVK